VSINDTDEPTLEADEEITDDRVKNNGPINHMTKSVAKNGEEDDIVSEDSEDNDSNVSIPL
jgi:hypothetical protein